jgi:two-component system sensor histidine kinase HydH
MVIEYEPLLVGDLASSMAMARAVAALAVTVLVVLAVVLGRRIARAAEEERRGERERRLVALGGMSAVMAHELRNPLASLKGHAQLLVENLEPGSRDRAKAELVVTEAQRMERLTHALLEFVRDAPLDRREIDTDDLLARALEPFPPDRVEVVREGGPKRASVDEARLAMAIGNLVRNALESAPDGKVEVRVAGPASELHVEVRDRGPGLPEGEGDRIFEPFVTTRVKGTGLGLAVARRAVEQHGGTLSGENAEGGGARFRIALKVDRPPP